MAFQVKISGIEQATGELKQAILAGERNGMEKIGERGVQLLVQFTPVGATGNLATAMFPQLIEAAGMMTEIVTAAPPADVYAAPVSEGTRPHFPPVNAIVPWVIKKFGETDEQTVRSIAFAIARKISRRGTVGAHNFDRALEALEPEVVGILETEIANACAAAGLGA